MFELAHIGLLWLLPLPVLVYFLFPGASLPKQAALKAPFFEEFSTVNSGYEGDRRQHWINLGLMSLSWVLLVLAAANPMWVGKAVPLPTQGRNIMMAVDLSGSMEKEDFNYKGRWIDRLSATKVVAGSFIDKRKGDRIGLILFGDEAYVQSPLTFDRKTVIRLLNESFIKLAGSNTAIGNAIGLAIKKIQQFKSQQKILILLTDGANTAGDIDPIKAATLAKSEGLKIYTIGIGSKSQNTQFGFVQFGSDLDETTLKKIAEITGGRYFRATNLQELNEIYQLLDELEPIKQKSQFFRPRQSYYYWPLLVATLLLIIAGAINVVNKK